MTIQLMIINENYRKYQKMALVQRIIWKKNRVMLAAQEGVEN